MTFQWDNVITEEKQFSYIYEFFNVEIFCYFHISLHVIKIYTNNNISTLELEPVNLKFEYNGT